jgi:hypothetical protein
MSHCRKLLTPLHPIGKQPGLLIVKKQLLLQATYGVKKIGSLLPLKQFYVFLTIGFSQDGVDEVWWESTSQDQLPKPPE